MIFCKIVLVCAFIISSLGFSQTFGDSKDNDIEVNEFSKLSDKEKVKKMLSFYHEEPNLYNQIINDRFLISAELLNEIEDNTLNRDGARCRC
jgi:hypothetical protein